jgi:hypothetical protein
MWMKPVLCYEKERQGDVSTTQENVRTTTNSLPFGAALKIQGKESHLNHLELLEQTNRDHSDSEMTGCMQLPNFP